MYFLVSELRIIVNTATPGHLTKNHAQGSGFANKLSWGPGFDRGWEIAKIQHTGLIPTQNRFFGIYTECETEFAFSFKNSEVCRNVL